MTTIRTFAQTRKNADEFHSYLAACDRVVENISLIFFREHSKNGLSVKPNSGVAFLTLTDDIYR